jgi:RNA polymerase sigma factor (sigma-70 family)
MEVTDADIQHYEGLVRKTASMYCAIVEEDYEDLCQIIRVKCWRALVAHRTGENKMNQDGWVFGCVRNLIKDLIKRQRRDWLFIEDIAPRELDRQGVVNGYRRDVFEMRYLQMTEEEAYRLVMEEVTLPSTLTEQERKVVSLLYLSFDYTEIGETIGISYGAVTKTMKSVREKMADWKPTPPVSETSLPLAA